MMLKAKHIHTKQLRLHYGEGPTNGVPLVLLHGGSARAQSWDPVLPALVAASHVVAPDLRGHGHSGWHTPYTLRSYAEDITALLHHIDEPAILCGHSLGGMVALMVAAHLRTAVRGLIIGDAPLRAETWLHALQATRPRLEEWHTLAVRYREVAPIAVALKTSPVEIPGFDAPRPAAEVFGVDSPWFEWMATNLAQLDPATLAILINEPHHAAEGY